VVVELGAGTGRLTRMLAGGAGRLVAFDAAPAMPEVAAERAQALGQSNCTFAVANNGSLPVDTAVADLVIAGWTVGYLVSWAVGSWQDEVHAVVNEMRRVAARGAKLVIIETLGTGFEEPTPPAKLQPYFARLEGAGFTRTAIRTDYRFDSPEEAVAPTRFFFGDPLADNVAESGTAEVPECTGIWTLQLP
jgi:ubiquinone/menaquinone biosynthesis C-methylase UbiE